MERIYELKPFAAKSWPPLYSAGSSVEYFNDLLDVIAEPAVITNLIQFDGTNWVLRTPAAVANDMLLNDLGDVDAPLPDVGDVLGFLGPNWGPLSPQDLAFLMNLGDLGDVDTGSPGLAEDGYVLQWDNTAGEFNLVPQSGGGPASLDDLTDVIITTPTVGDYFYFNGTNWVNTTVAPGSGVGGAGVAPQVAYWDGISSLAGDAQFIYDDVNNRLRIGATPADRGAIGLPTGIANGIFFDTTTLTKPGFWMEYDATLGSIYKFSSTSGQTSDASKIHFQLGDVSSAGPRSWMFSSEGSGKGSFELEGGIILHNSNGFQLPSTIGIPDATTVMQTSAGNFLTWYRSAGGTPARKLGLTVDDEWSFHRNINNATFGANHVVFTTEPASASPMDFIFMNPGTSTGGVRTEGPVTISNSNGFSRTTAVTGDLRLPTEARVRANTSANPSRDLIGVEDATNRVLIGGNSKWPLSEASGALTNDGSGGLAWSAIPGGPVNLNDLADVTNAAVVSGQLLGFNGATWNNVAGIASSLHGIRILYGQIRPNGGGVGINLIINSSTGWAFGPGTATIVPTIPFTSAIMIYSNETNLGSGLTFDNGQLLFGTSSFPSTPGSTPGAPSGGGGPDHCFVIIGV